MLYANVSTNTMLSIFMIYTYYYLLLSIQAHYCLYNCLWEAYNVVIKGRVDI